MNIVYTLEHKYDRENGCEEVKFIGVYSDRAGAEKTIEKLKDQPGFRDYPSGFHLEETPIDVVFWTEGFVPD